MRVKSVLAALAAVLALAACSSDPATPGPGGSGPNESPSSGDGDPVDVCALVTVEAASAAYGEQLGAGVLTTADEGALCTFPAAVGSAVIYYFRDQAGQWEVLKTTNASVYADGFEEISGLGDAAYTTGIDVYVLVGNDFFRFSILGPFPDRGARALALAQAADL